MKSIYLKLVGINSKIITNIIVDNQNIKCKKIKFDSYEAIIQTEKEEIELTLSNQLELKGKFWWLFALISFVISIFGIFEPPYDRKCISINCFFKIQLNDINQVEIKFNRLSSSGKAVELETQNHVEEIKNEYYIDKMAKKRWTIIFIIKIIVWITIAILVGYFISKKF